MEIESVLSKLGRLGKFQILMYIFCGLQGISFPVWDMLSVTSFMAPTPDYACRIEIIDEDDKPHVKYATLNSSSMSTGANCEEGELVFNLDTYGRTMVTEWQLVGEKAMFVELSQSLFMVGMMLGSVVLGQMSDMFGRRPVLIISATLSPLMSVASGFVPNIFVFTGLRIMIGFICPGAILTSYVLALELFPACRRAAASILLSSFNGIGYVGLAVLAYYIKDWRNLQIATGAIRCGLIPLCLFVPESIQWLAAKGKHQKLEKLLQRIAKINKIDIAFPILETKTDIPAAKPPDTEEELYTPIINEETTEKGKSMEDLFMYDSALSLDRDYIPDEDQFSTNTYSSESETEEPVQPPTSSSRTRFPSALFQQAGVFPGHCQQVSTGNLCHVNSSISILSELQKGCEQFESYENLTKPEHDPSSAVSTLPVGKPSQKMSKPQRKKSVSMYQLPNVAAFILDTESSDSPTSSSESGETVKYAEFLRTASIPNITKNPSVEAMDMPIHVDSVPQRPSALTRAHKGPPNLTIQSNEGMGSSFLLSVPTLALPFGYSQNMFPNVGVQYENIESSQSEESLHDDSDTSGFNSSTTNVDRLTDYEALEAGYSFNTSPQQKGYSEIKTTSDERPKPKKIRKGYNALDLFRKSSVRLVTVVSMIMWFATYSVYVGLSMSTDELAGDPYINFSLVGLVEIPAVIVAAFSAVRIGRRYPSGVFHFLAALSCCVFLMIPSNSAASWTPLVSVVAILSAKCFTSAAYNVECLLTAEVLPTPLRTVGIGMFVLCSRIGGVIVPFILLTGESWNKYPMMIFAALSVVSSLMLLPLPEMIGMPQPQTPDDIKKIRKISKERRNFKAKLPVSFV